MKCEACNYGQNAPTAKECQFCGEWMQSNKKRTVVESAGNPGTKRRTLYEPRHSETPAASPAPQQPAANDDFFSRPRPARSPLNRDDSWGHIASKEPAVQPREPASRLSGARWKRRTIIDRGPEQIAPELTPGVIRGALFIQVGSGQPQIVPLYEGLSPLMKKRA